MVTTSHFRQREIRPMQAPTLRLQILGGAAADHYELPPEYTKQFTIQKAPTKVALSADIQNENHSNQVHFEVNVAGVNDEVLEGSIIFKDGDTVIAKDVPVSDGKASYVWKSPEVGRHYMLQNFASF